MSARQAKNGYRFVRTSMGVGNRAGFESASHIAHALGRIGIALVSAVFVLSHVGCSVNDADKESLGPDAIAKWRDPNIKIIAVGAYNYTDYDIYGVFLLPPERDSIEYAARTTGRRATADSESQWDGGPGSSPSLAWDLRWKTPKRFKVWWHRVTDAELYERSSPYPKGGGMFDPYDIYASKETRPGSAWCEYEVEVKETFGEFFGAPFPQRRRDTLILYFYPDGTVQAHLEYGVEPDVSVVDIKKRHSLPVLKERPCIKEVSNPFFGHKRPTVMN